MKETETHCPVCKTNWGPDDIKAVLTAQTEDVDGYMSLADRHYSEICSTCGYTYFWENDLFQHEQIGFVEIKEWHWSHMDGVQERSLILGETQRFWNDKCAKPFFAYEGNDTVGWLAAFLDWVQEYRDGVYPFNQAAMLQHFQEEESERAQELQGNGHQNPATTTYGFEQGG